MFTAIADLLVVQALGLDPTSPFGGAVHFFVLDITKILVLLTGIVYAMGLLRTVLDPIRVRNALRGRSALTARFLAVGLGAVTPFCSCSSVPLFVGFVEAGIPLGVTLSFLIASPMVNEVAVGVLIGCVGWRITALYVAAGLTVAFVGGIALERFRPERWLDPAVRGLAVGEGVAAEAPRGLRERHALAMVQVREIVGRIWPYVVGGVAVGAFVHGYVPADTLAELAGGTRGTPSVGSVIAAVAVGVPVYADAVGIVPVAESLLGKGVPLGSVLAFMMAATALSLPQMIILRRVVRWPLLALFAGVLAVSFVGVGILFNVLGGA